MIASVCALKAHELVVHLGDTHIYLNHIEQVREQLLREPYPWPQLWVNQKVKEIDDFEPDDLQLVDYRSHDPIKSPMSV